MTKFGTLAVRPATRAVDKARNETLKVWFSVGHHAVAARDNVADAAHSVEIRTAAALIRSVTRGI